MRKRGFISSGFTLVELLIVIVVIAILAAITIVAYNGVSGKARVSVLQSDLATAATFMETYNAQNGQYPDSLSTALNSGLRLATPLANLIYSVNNTASPATWGLTVIDPTSGQSYYRNNTTQASSAPGAWVTNYAVDPDAAGSTTHFNASGSAADAYSTVAIASDEAHHGTTSLKKVVSSANASGAGATVGTGDLVANPGEHIYWSFWVYATRATTIFAVADTWKVSDDSYGCGGTSHLSSVAVPANTWTYVSADYTPAVACSRMRLGGYNAALQVGDAIYFDEFMVTKSPAAYTYADGNTANWVWNGAANNSSSTGPATASN